MDEVGIEGYYYFDSHTHNRQVFKSTSKNVVTIPFQQNESSISSTVSESVSIVSEGLTGKDQKQNLAYRHNA